MNGQPKWLLAGLLLMLPAAAFVYAPAWNGDFIWDDDSYVSENRTLTEPGGLRDIWFRPGATTQYYPLVHTTYWIEYRLWGLDTRGYHTVNILLHVTSAFLIWMLLRRFALPGAFVAALLFVVHPVCVESVAWITERKNVLSLALALGSLHAYWTHRESRRTGHLAAAAALFVAALLAKTVVASLPAVLAVLVWWREGRVPRRDLVRLAPLFAIGAAMGLFTVYIERNYIGAQGSEWALTTIERVQLAAHNVVFYARKIVWPSPLTFFYPRWTPDAAAPARWIPFVLLGTFAIAAWAGRGRKGIGRGPIAVLMLFAGILLPALGFLDVYPFRYSFAADHFQYHAAPVLIAGLTVAIASRLRGPSGARPGIAIGAVIACAFGLLARSEAHTYRDLESLWRDTIEENDGAWMAYNNLGQLLAQRGDHEQAVGLYEAALRIRSPYPKAQNNLATSMAALGQGDRAIEQYRAAIAADPSNLNARSNLGLALANAGRIDEAVAVLQEAIGLNPRMPSLHTNLGVAYARGGRAAEALAAFERVVTLTPRDPDAHFRLGVTRSQAGDAAGARRAMQDALRIRPDHAGARAWIAQNP